MLMIADYFSEILNTFTIEKQMDFKDNEFASRFASNVPDELLDIINDTNFNAKILFGQYGWADYPTIIISHSRFESGQEALVIEYRFNATDSSVSVSLVPRMKDVEDYMSLRNDLIHFLDDYDTASFTTDEDSNSILYKNYPMDDLNDDAIERDLKCLIEIYTSLTGYFLSYLDEINGIVYENKAFYSKGKVHEKKSFYSKGVMPDDEYILALNDIKEDVYYENRPIKFNKMAPIPQRLRISNISPVYPTEKLYDNSLERKEDFFKDEIIERIAKLSISYDDYRDILKRIRNNAELMLINLIESNNILLYDLKTKDRILLYSKSFVKTEYKSVGKRLGSYAFNEIKIDDRLSNPLIITSIIHELTHFILERILKESLMKILETDDTPLISAYIKILLEDNDLNYLMDEFCAHTVEGRFALYGFQDYSSFIYKLDEISDMYSKDDIDYALLIANTFAFDIKDIIEVFIDDDLREDIKDEFLNLNERPDHTQLDFEIESKLDNAQFLDALSIILLSGIAECLSKEDKLDRYMNKYNRLINQ